MITADHPERAAELPKAGVTARRLNRFEAQLAEWLETSQGRFACFYAARRCADPTACATCEHHPARRAAAGGEGCPSLPASR